MKAIFIVLTAILLHQTHINLINTVWARRITASADNTLTFKPNGLVLEYDCELNYTFHCSYKVSGNTIIIRGKDDSHSEDNGKINSSWVTTYLIKNNALYIIKNQVFERGKWKEYGSGSLKIPDYKMVKPIHN